MRCIRGPSPCCAAQGNTQTLCRPTVLSRRACVWTAHAALATTTLQFAQNGAARPVPDQSVAQRVYEETRSSIVGIADFRVVDGAVSDVTPLGSGLVWDQRGYVVTTYGGVARAGSAPAASTSQSSSAAAAPGSGAPVPPAAPLVKGASVAQSAMPVAGRQLRVSILDASDGQMKQWTATVVGTSPLHNLAVLLLSDVPQESLAPVQLGSNADIRVGQAAFAVGLPFGQSSHALSYGVISGARRPVPSGIPGLLLPGGAFLTDATVDNMTSGGALVDSSGRLMGMLLAPPNATRASALGLTRPSSLAFAVPVDVVTCIVPQLIAYGEPRQT